MVDRHPRSVRIGLRAYATLLRLMPRGFRVSYGAESLDDVRDMLDEASEGGIGPVASGTMRVCVDLMGRLPTEWLAASAGTFERHGRGAPAGRTGMGERLMNALTEFRRAARTLAKRPGFTLVAMLTLALGIGANVAVFTMVNAILLRPLAFEESERIVEYRHHAPGLDLPELNNSEGIVAFYRENADFYESTAAFDRGSANLAGGDEAARVDVLDMSPEIFDVLRVQPMMGRPFTAEDTGPDGAAVALLAHDSWRARFGSDPGIIGRTVEIDGSPVEVVGVMPPDFAFPDQDVDLYTAMYVDPQGAFGTFGMRTVSRLAPGVSIEEARMRSTELLTRLPDYLPDLEASFLEQAAFAVSVETLRDRTVVDVESSLWIILGTVAFVLLIACANVANLFLVRAESRQKEMAVRAAMGAGRRTVAASFLSESLLLGLGGGILGVLFALWGVRTLLSLTEVPRSAEVSIDATSLSVALLLSVLAGLAFGILPMARYTGTRFAGVLRDGGRGSTGGRERHRARNVLVASQLALALVLLVGSGLMLRSFAELRSVDLGLDPEGVLAMGLNRNAGEDVEITARFFQDAADRIAALPGVARVGITNNLPLASGGANGGSFHIESKPRDEEALPPIAMHRAVGGEYFTSLGIPILSGRDLERADWEEGKAVVWVNEEFERTLLDGDALGERIGWRDADGPWAEVVGVVGNVREFGLADEELRPSAYLPLRNGGAASVEAQSAVLTIRMAAGQDPASIIAAARSAVHTLDAQVPITATRTMQDVVDEAMESTSITMSVLAVATAMALFLGAIGLAGVITYVVGQRTREIGVRVALGAEASDVSRLIMRQSVMVIAGGTVLGLAGAFGLTGLMEAILFEVSTTDPLTFIAAPAVLVGVSLLATWLPVRRAARISPTEALRSE